jgi:hypothetical protein
MNYLGRPEFPVSDEPPSKESMQVLQMTIDSLRTPLERAARTTSILFEGDEDTVMCLTTITLNQSGVPLSGGAAMRNKRYGAQLSTSREYDPATMHVDTVRMHNAITELGFGFEDSTWMHDLLKIIKHRRPDTLAADLLAHRQDGPHDLPRMTCWESPMLQLSSGAILKYAFDQYVDVFENPTELVERVISLEVTEKDERVRYSFRQFSDTDSFALERAVVGTTSPAGWLPNEETLTDTTVRRFTTELLAAELEIGMEPS